jgi:hypothetical protein
MRLVKFAGQLALATFAAWCMLQAARVFPH